jgi:hypothetical protein
MGTLTESYRWLPDQDPRRQWHSAGGVASRVVCARPVRRCTFAATHGLWSLPKLVTLPTERLLIGRVGHHTRCQGLTSYES